MPGLLVLATAKGLTEVQGRSPIVSVTFPLGKGHVLHVLPQTFQDSGTLAGVIALQRLLVNFIAQALRATK